MVNKSDFKLLHYNSYNINSVCAKAWFPNNENDLISIYQQNTDTQKIILGNGNNTILSKEFYQEEFIILNGCFNKIEINGTELIAEAGATFKDVSEIAEKNSLTGCEFFYDIPSSVGGGVVMNAGTKEGETKNILKKVRYLDLEDMLIKEKVKEELELEYRNSFFQKKKNKVILKALFQLELGNKARIRQIMEELKERRWSKQPREYPNSGSVFKRPPGKFVGPMLDELGLKGFTIGGAQVSKKHSGFIINTGNATGKDILSLISEIQKRVKEKFGVSLEVEQRII